jgi:hypothetical protein
MTKNKITPFGKAINKAIDKHRQQQSGMGAEPNAMDFTRKGDVVLCPYCDEEFPVKNNVEQARHPQEAHACRAYARCPRCKKSGCVSRVEPKKTLTPSSTFR